jgi:hypothetical protein
MKLGEQRAMRVLEGTIYKTLSDIRIIVVRLAAIA